MLRYKSLRQRLPRINVLSTLTRMQVTIPLVDEDGGAAQCALRVSTLPDGRMQICKVSPVGAVVGGSADVTTISLGILQALAFGKICWLPNAEEPTFRLTGMGKTVEIRENRANAEPLFAEAEALKTVLNQAAAAN